jgi:tetratricopeptide (TPR) repeat protein
VQKAISLLNKQDYAGAIALGEAGIKVEPQNGSNLADMGYIADAAGDTAMAERYTRQALSVDKDVRQAYLNLSDILARKGRHEGAILLAEKARVMDPKDADIPLAIAFAHTLAGKLPEAEAAVKEARSMLPKERSQIYYFVLAKLREKQGRKADAIADYKLVLKSKPNEYYRRYSVQALEALK